VDELNTNRPSVGGVRFIGVDIAKIVGMFLVVSVHVDNFCLPFVGSKPSRPARRPLCRACPLPAK
jgi:hypothetical protein